MSISKKIKKKLLKILGDIKIFRYPSFIIYDPKTYGVTAEETRIIDNTIQMGDILLRFYENYLDGYFIPGKFTHASLATNNHTIIHAIGKGVCEEDILRFCRCDGLVILRPRVSTESKSKAVEYARSKIGCEYDFDFNHEDENTYFCTELVYWSYKNVLNVNPVLYKKCYGMIQKETILPDEYLNSSMCDIIYATSKAKEKMLKM